MTLEAASINRRLYPRKPHPIGESDWEDVPAQLIRKSHLTQTGITAMLRKQKEGDSNAGARWTLGAVLLWMKVASIIAQCSKPEVKGNVVLSTEDLLKNSFSEGSTARYQCTVGYTTKSGSGVINCTNGVWSVLSLTCQKKTCEPPGEVENGYFNISEGIEFGAKIKATCNKGYMIVGRNYLQCLDSGWSGRPPVCEG
ncbi:membrane cofactor protein-like isoform X1 [Arapaima gigas]